MDATRRANIKQGARASVVMKQDQCSVKPTEGVVKDILANLPKLHDHILKYASLAPSSHNCQPWSVYLISDTELRIQADPARRLPEVDPTNRETLLSIGAFWENLEQAADSLGFDTQTEVTATKTTDTDILEVKLIKRAQEPQPSTVSPALKAMEKRVTNRGKYEQSPLAPSHLDQCLQLLPHHLTYFPRESEEGRWISAGLPEAMRQQAFHDGKQAELAQWMRFSRAEIAKNDGLTAEMLGLQGLVKFIWYTFMTPKNAMSRTFRKGAVKSMKERVTHCSGFFVITGDDSSVPSILQAGRDFQGLALKCTQLSIAVHPVSQLIQEPPFNQQLETQLGLSKPVQWMLCAGYPKIHPQPAIRRPVKDFIRR